MMRLKDAKFGFIGDNFRVLQTLFPGAATVPGVALTLNPRLKALGLKPSAFNLQVAYHRRHNIRGASTYQPPPTCYIAQQ